MRKQTWLWLRVCVCANRWTKSSVESGVWDASRRARYPWSHQTSHATQRYFQHMRLCFSCLCLCLCSCVCVRVLCACMSLCMCVDRGVYTSLHVSAYIYVRMICVYMHAYKHTYVHVHVQLLTGGTVPMAVTLATEAVYTSFRECFSFVSSCVIYEYPWCGR